MVCSARSATNVPAIVSMGGPFPFLCYDVEVCGGRAIVYSRLLAIYWVRFQDPCMSMNRVVGRI